MVYSYLKKINKILAILIVVAIVLFGAYALFNNSKNIISIKLYSYDSLKEAGLWIKENSEPGDVIINTGTPENTYYSERETFHYPDNESDFPALLEEKKPKYLVISIWEQSPEWAYTWFERNPDKVEQVAAFTSHDNPKQATAVIYRLKDV